MDVQLVIFDFDGTLGDTRRNIVMTLQQTMKQMQLPIADAEACAATIGLTLENSFMALFPHLSEEQARQCATTYRQIFDINKKMLVPELFPHVTETLQQLTRQGIKAGVASSRSTTSLREFLNEMGLTQYVSHVVGAEDVPHPKPAPDAVVQTLETLNVAADATMVVGDMPVDILMGLNAGVLTCGVTYGNSTYQQLEHAGAHHIIHDIAELVTIATPDTSNGSKNSNEPE